MARTLPTGARHTAVLLAAAAIVAACGGASSGASPSAAPTPRVTPNPHLPTPATAQQVFSGLGKRGIRISANTATLGVDGSEVVTKIYGTYLGWPLDVTQYRSETALTEVTKWTAGEEPGKGEPPIALAGANILITWGPTQSGKAPRKPDARQSDALHELVAALDVLLSPIKARTNVPVKVAVAVSEPAGPAPSPAP